MAKNCQTCIPLRFYIQNRIKKRFNPLSLFVLAIQQERSIDFNDFNCGLVLDISHKPVTPVGASHWAPV